MDVSAETVGQFATQHFAENLHRIPVISQIIIKGSFKLLVIPADAWGCRFPFIENVLAPSDCTVWGHGGTSDQNWGVTLGGPYSNVVVAWGSTFPIQHD